MSKKVKKQNGNNAEGKSAIKAILVGSCCIFTVAIFVIYIFTTIVLGNATFTTNIGNTAAVFALSFALSAATTVFERKKLPFWESSLILFFLIGALYYLIVVRLSGMHKSLSATLTAMGIYVAAFAVYIVVKAIISSKKKKKTSSGSDKEYEPKF